MNGIAPLDVEIVRARVKKLLEQGHFSICDVDDILKLTGGVPDGRAYQRLRALHCVNYRDMTPALRIELPRLLQLVLEGPPIPYTYNLPTTETRLLK